MNLGGQAIVEGVMIKSPSRVCMAVRLPSDKIRFKCIKHVSPGGFCAWPFIRGVIQLFDMLIVGVKALQWSSEQQGDDEKLDGKGWFFVFAFAFTLTIGLFVLLPYYGSRIFFKPDTLVFGLIDGLLRLLVFFVYLFGIGFMSDVRRMFEYHGAEHMSVHCYESGKELSVANAKHFPPEHSRCGTSLLIFVIVVSIIIFSLVRSPHWYYNVPARIFLIPVIAGISYELLKFSSKFKCLRWLTLPGVWTQKLTTRRPDDKQLAVALVAVREAAK